MCTAVLDVMVLEAVGAIFFHKVFFHIAGIRAMQESVWLLSCYAHSTRLALAHHAGIHMTGLQPCIAGATVAQHGRR